MSVTAFSSKEEIVDHLKDQYIKEGVVLTTKRSKEAVLWLKCDRGGSYRNRYHLSDETRQRKTSSRLAGCPFEITCRLKDGVWVVTKVAGSHNHPVGIDLAGHSAVRRPSPNEVSRIKELGCHGIAPKQILSVLHAEFEGNQTTAKEVYNVLQSAKVDFLRGRTAIEALVDLVSENVYVSKVWLQEQMLHGLFFMHNDSVKLTKAYGTVFLLDCTYQTNKFHMPLLNIVGITCTYATFNAGFAFLREETEESYTWALKQLAAIVQPTVLCTDRELALMNSIAAVFPTCRNLLCVWHINKNIATNCKKYFENGEEWNCFLAAWNRLVHSSSEARLVQDLAAFQEAYLVTYPDALAYINTTWMPHKAKFVACYTNDCPHFGSSTTSRVEGSHHVMKSYLRLASLDLLVVFNRLTLMLSNQVVELNTEIRRQQVKIPHFLNRHIFRELHYKVSFFAMGKLQEQLQLTDDGSNGAECGGKFKKTWGLPCKHDLRLHLLRGTCIPLDAIHPQWQLQNAPIGIEAFEANDRGAAQITPRKKMLSSIEKLLYTPNPRVSSLMMRLQQVSDEPDAEVLAPRVVKKRGRPAGKAARRVRKPTTGEA